MAVGDFVNIRLSARGINVYRRVAQLDDHVSAETAVLKPIFSDPAAKLPAVRSRRRTWLILAIVAVAPVIVGIVAAWLAGTAIAIAAAVLCGAAALLLGWRTLRPDSGRRSMLRLMAEYHDVGLQPTGAGLEAIGVPFPHAVLLLGKERFEYRVALEAAATGAFKKRWSNFVDPLVELRARAFVSNRLGEDEIALFFGTGIFAPRASERPVGRVEILLAEAPAGAQPCFPDQTPAGLYRGQSSLSFSSSTDLTPATVEGLPVGSGIFCLRPKPGGSDKAPYVLDWQPGPDETALRPARDAIDPPAAADALFRVTFPDVAFDVLVIDDTRPSRLLHAPPSDRGFAIVGVLEPEAAGRGPDRWWIDIDDSGRLIASGMRRAQRSLVCRRGTLTVWDWSAASAAAAHAVRLQAVETPVGERRVLMAPPGRPFGWLNAPEKSQPIGYTPGQPNLFELDWLDFAGAVEEVVGRADRLGAWLHAQRSVALMPGGDRGQGDEALLVAAPGETAFNRGSHAPWTTGTRIICDQLLLEVVDGGRS
ncbi:hypothetical protein [Bradyrhizobium aeschynomenes]|uniref:hypothetical protein n=1 Tax=Bradyrhizobium aeschynomenes TaxID=2734909 RepID=UPI001558322F|nr:hypothetical protein [Bradyrhizobium aeschynomenes]NPV19283.1 hypothetical protein [Bradyrhizobium aeschynomenes]